MGDLKWMPSPGKIQVPWGLARVILPSPPGMSETVKTTESPPDRVFFTWELTGVSKEKAHSSLWTRSPALGTRIDGSTESSASLSSAMTAAFSNTAHREHLPIRRQHTLSFSSQWMGAQREMGVYSVNPRGCKIFLFDLSFQCLFLKDTHCNQSGLQVNALQMETLVMFLAPPRCY